MTNRIVRGIMLTGVVVLAVCTIVMAAVSVAAVMDDEWRDAIVGTAATVLCAFATIGTCFVVDAKIDR